MPKKIVYRPKGHESSELIRNSKEEFPVFDQSPAEFAKELNKWFEEYLDT